MTLFPDISVVIPVYKNKNTLDELFQRLIDTLEVHFSAIEILFVDDACPEGSIDVLKRIAKQDNRVAVVAMAQNVGQQTAVLSGLQQAKGGMLVILDADLQDPPEAIPKLATKLKEGYDVVFAGRKGKYQIGTRLLTSRLYKWALHLLTDVPASAGLFLIMTEDVSRKLLTVTTDSPHIVAMLGTLDIKTIAVPVERDSRPSGQSAYTSWMRLRIGIGAALWVLRWKLGLQKDIPFLENRFPIKAVLQNKYYFEE